MIPSIVYRFHPSAVLAAAQTMPDTLAPVKQTVYVVCVFIAVALLAYYSTKVIASVRTGRQRARNIDVLETVSIGHQTALSLVKVGEKVVLIGVTKDRVCHLADVNANELLAAQPENKAVILNFKNVYQKLLEPGRGKEQESSDE